MSQQAIDYYETHFGNFEQRFDEHTEAWRAKAAHLRIFAKRWVLEGYAVHDVDTLVSMVTEDFTLEDPGLFGQVIRGPEEFRRFLQDTFRAFPDTAFGADGPPYLSLDGTSVIQPWWTTGTFTGPLEWGPSGKRRPFAPTGRRFDFRGLDVYTFRGDRVCAMRSVYDAMQVCRQLGILPPPDSLPMRLAPWALAIPARLMRLGGAR